MLSSNYKNLNRDVTGGRALNQNRNAHDFRLNIKKVAILASFAALAYLSVLVIRIPITSFLDYEVKDVFITMGGFLFGPLSAFWLSLTVSLIQMCTISGTGLIGFIMNFFATFTFSFTASTIYQRQPNHKGAAIGLLLGSLTASCWMIVANALITPLFLGIPMQEVWNMLLPLILPFNIVKNLCNAVLSFVLFKPAFTALTSANLLDRQKHKGQKGALVIAIIFCLIGLIGAILFLFCF